MKYEIKLVEDSGDWEEFLKTTTPNIFVQSARYGDFFKELGEDAFMVGIYDGGKMIGGSLVVTTTARRGKFLYLPYGPKLDFSDRELLRQFNDFLVELARKEKADFIRVAPFLEDTEESRQLFRDLGYRSAPMHVLAETTWILDLDEDEETLMKNMRQTTRNLIRRGEREGVEIRVSSDEAAIDRLVELLDETAKRHHFTPFSKKYIQSEFDAFKDTDEVKIFEAYFEGEMVSSAIIFFYGDTAVYRHSASSSKRIKCQPTYFLQWNVIREAKRRGLKHYNFWGIAPEGASKKHPFYGITVFKTGFGGYKKDLLHCQDLPVTKKYWLNWLIETLRRIRRGF
ncbi:MAG: peptidoglycan bridge formation glycyltransferase FemA/FemB family protein [Nitrospirae bacterium]|nr:peptidoglycan bridge formation glycyltransferase FemA/FemB family protein [Nitrospirota bacterium]